MSNGIDKNPLLDISRVYLEQISEKKDDSYLEPDMKKRQKNNEKARKELAKGPQMKNPHFEEKQQGWDAVNSLAGAYKEMHQVDENRRAARAAGGYKDDSKKQNDPSKAGFTGVGNMSIDQIRKMSASMDKKKTQKEGLDPVGKEDGDIDNDGDKDSSDKYLLKRRKAIGNAMKKKLKESRSLSEVMTDTDSETIVKEKKVNNKIKINPKLGEAVEEMGGSLIEHIEIDEMDFIIESVYDELLEEGYAEDDVEEAIENAMEATVTFGSDTKPMKKDGSQVGSRRKFLKRKAGEFLQKSKKKVGMAVAQARVDAYNKKREVKQAATDKVNQKKQGLKNFIKNKAQKVVDRMSEDIETEGYEPMTPERKLRVDRAKRNAYDNDQRAQRSGDNKEADKQFKRRMAMDSKTKMKKEEVENIEELHKGRHGQTEKQYQDSRSDAGKMVSGDSKMSGSRYAQGRRTSSDAGPQTAGGSQKPASQGKMDSGSRTDLTFRKAALKKKAAAMSEGEQPNIEHLNRYGGHPEVKPKKKKKTPFEKENPGHSDSKPTARFTKADREEMLAAKKEASDKVARDAAKYRGKKKAAEMKENAEVSEGVYGDKTSMRKAAAKERASEKKAGSKAKAPGRLGPSAGKSYADHEEHSIRAHDKITKKTKPSVVGMTSEEASMSPQELQLQKKKARVDRMIAMKRAQDLSKKKASGEPPAKAMGEATEDSLRDRRMERGGVDGNNRYNKAPSNTPNTFGKKKPASDGMSALEKVKASIRAKHGQGAIMDTKKK